MRSGGGPSWWASPLRLGRRALCLGATIVSLTAPVAAHEIGTTRVTATILPDHHVEVVVTTDGAALLEKLEQADGLEPAGGRAPGAIEAGLRARRATLGTRLSLRVDDVEVQPAIDVRVDPPAAPLAPPAATLTLRGRIPDHARTLTWRYGWTFASYAFTVRTGTDDAASPIWLDGDAVSPEVPVRRSAPASGWSVARQYLALGFTHILPLGLDHVLFVLGLYLLSSRPRTVLAQVSAFTLAHSITLGLSMWGIVDAPSRIVEPLIAVSIAYVAIENLVLTELRSWRIGLVFAFGLLHGLGFAGALRELGLPRASFATALVSFNVGVEAGQLAVIGLAFVCVGWRFADRPWYRHRVVVPTSALIAGMAVYWTLARLYA